LFGEVVTCTGLLNKCSLENMNAHFLSNSHYILGQEYKLDSGQRYSEMRMVKANIMKKSDKTFYPRKWIKYYTH
jgi:hypothetical protein